MARSAIAGVALTRQRHEDVDRVAALLAAGAKDAGKHLLGVCAGPGHVAAPRLAVYDRGAQGLLGSVVGGSDPWDRKKGEQGVALACEMVEQLDVGRMGWVAREQLVGALLEGGERWDHEPSVDVPGSARIPERERVL